ncbi:hypothetical protein [Ammoniphilus resinae]|uniref:Uncharacterized protein n=1 Tax=Ammoniphilus resinae TaxID=861532 RepID=A0ABS4GQJ0_9BACL|nr:hypothetical protein [Ammoniphilus resinae]MBP1932535.1 hypothetical protein [Ammoniphilus resinae]
MPREKLSKKEQEEIMKHLPAHLQDMSPAWRNWFITLRKEMDMGREMRPRKMEE